MRAMRWTARILGVLMAGFFLLMFIGESGSLAKAWNTLRTVEPIHQFGFSLGGLYIVAMFLALKWERLGALLGLAGAVSFFFFVFVATRSDRASWGFLLPLFLLCALPAVLYLVCWQKERKLKRTEPAV